MKLTRENHLKITSIQIGILIILVLLTLIFQPDCSTGMFSICGSFYSYMVLSLAVIAGIIMIIVTTIGYTIGRKKGWSARKTYFVAIIAAIFAVLFLFKHGDIQDYGTDILMTTIRNTQAPPYTHEFISSDEKAILVLPSTENSVNSLYKVSHYDKYLIINLDGTIVNRIDLKPHLDSLPNMDGYELSPSGTMIAYTTYNPSAGSSNDHVLSIRNLNSGATTTIGSICGGRLDWNITGTKLGYNACQQLTTGGYVSKSAYFDLATHQTVRDGTIFRKWGGDDTLLSKSSDSSRSPDKNYSVRTEYVDETDTYLMNFTKRVIIEDSTGKQLFSSGRASEYQPVLWSPDSKYLLYGNRHDGLYIFDMTSHKEYKVADMDPVNYRWYIPN